MRDPKQIAEAKAAAKRTARTRSKQGQVTSRPPNLYQIPHINVPMDFAECARLIQLEFSSVASSQSIMLTLWQENEDRKATITKLESRIKTLEVLLVSADRQN